MPLTHERRVCEGRTGQRDDENEDCDAGDQTLSPVIGHDVMETVLVNDVDVADDGSDAPARAVEHERHHGPRV